MLSDSELNCCSSSIIFLSALRFGGRIVDGLLVRMVAIVLRSDSGDGWTPAPLFGSMTSPGCLLTPAAEWLPFILPAMLCKIHATTIKINNNKLMQQYWNIKNFRTKGNSMQKMIRHSLVVSNIFTVYYSQ